METQNPTPETRIDVRPMPDDIGNFDPCEYWVRRVDPLDRDSYDLARLECGHQTARITHETTQDQIKFDRFWCHECGDMRDLDPETREILTIDPDSPF